MKNKLVLSSIIGLAAISLAQAQSITLVNPSFEQPGTDKISTGWLNRTRMEFL